MDFKRLFDFVFSFLGLVFLGWMIILLWVIASIDTKSNGLFIQSRIGRFGEEFSVYKLKSMKDSNVTNLYITTSTDPRITSFGSFLRKFKLDEFPQLYNVLIGKMSFVGPRPDVKGYADKLIGENRQILNLRPGITGPASLKYKDEEFILNSVGDPKKYNDEIIYPDKVRINLDYYYNNTVMGDIKLIIKTIF